MMNKRSNGVGGPQYLVHILAAEVDARGRRVTLCGRVSASVNLLGFGESEQQEQVCRSCCVSTKVRAGAGPTPDAARHAAALAVFGSLDAGTRAKLGECP